MSLMVFSLPSINLHVLQEVRDAVLRFRLIAGAGGDVSAEGDGFDAVHAFRDDRQAGGEAGRLNEFVHLLPGSWAVTGAPSIWGAGARCNNGGMDSVRYRAVFDYLDGHPATAAARPARRALKRMNECAMTRYGRSRLLLLPVPDRGEAMSEISRPLDAG